MFLQPAVPNCNASNDVRVIFVSQRLWLSSNLDDALVADLLFMASGPRNFARFRIAVAGDGAAWGGGLFLVRGDLLGVPPPTFDEVADHGFSHSPSRYRAFSVHRVFMPGGNRLGAFHGRSQAPATVGGGGWCPSPARVPAGLWKRLRAPSLRAPMFSERLSSSSNFPLATVTPSFC